MPKKIVIVESPTKSKTLKKFLGADFDVIASGGHIMDLPPDRLAVDIEGGFVPQYEPIRGKGKLITSLKKAAKESSEIFLASDPDREGEAIAWHISQLIGSDKKVGRVRFNEITKTAVLEGIKHPDKIDLRKVDAQQARRVLDRLVGYKVSPLLWKTLYKGLSAGRVQSVALRLICEREAEIDVFVPVEYWHIHADLEHEQAVFTARAVKYQSANLEIADEESAKKHEAALKNCEYNVESIETKRISKNPYPPYITSSLQLVAARTLGFSASRTMRIAQELYEGIELGKEGPSGLITYMRTDSVRISDEAKSAVAAFITKEYGSEFLQIRNYKAGKASQDAHEAIRPTDVFHTPESIKDYLTKEQFKLYELIWQRFVACMMSSALYDQTKVTIVAGDYELAATERALVFEGFQKVYTDKNGDEEESVKLPKLNKKDKCRLLEITPSQHFTKPPPRFTEGTLVKEMEDNGVGRPSTYAQIIKTLLTRKYIAKEKKSLLPTSLGKEVYLLLIKLFPGLFEVGFTADMEEKLDRVEDGELNWIAVVSDFYKGFEPLLEKANSNRAKLKRDLEEKTEHICEKCGSPMIIKWGRHGRFLACTNFPECKNTKPIDDAGKPVEQETIDKKCPNCGKALIVKHDRRGRRFIACSGYPDCKYTEPYDMGFKCPNENCNGHVQERYTRRGKVFYGCSNYPDCDFASWDPPIEGPCPTCGCETMFMRVRKNGTSKVCVACKYREAVEV
jgi:DNA topoisomerase-1